MTLSQEQKIIYSIMYDATMISRSIGVCFGKSNSKIKSLRQAVFKDIEILTEKMELYINPILGTSL